RVDRSASEGERVQGWQLAPGGGREVDVAEAEIQRSHRVQGARWQSCSLAQCRGELVELRWQRLVGIRFGGCDVEHDDALQLMPTANLAELPANALEVCAGAAAVDAQAKLGLGRVERGIHRCALDDGCRQYTFAREPLQRRREAVLANVVATETEAV